MKTMMLYPLEWQPCTSIDENRADGFLITVDDGDYFIDKCRLERAGLVMNSSVGSSCPSTTSNGEGQ